MKLLKLDKGGLSLVIAYFSKYNATHGYLRHFFKKTKTNGK